MKAPNDTIPALDGLRGLACLLVLISHAGRTGWIFDVDSGQLGVMLFFTLSGFLMAHHYMKPGIQPASYWLAFLTRRFFRIYPLFFFMLLVSHFAYSLSHAPYYAYFSWQGVFESLLLQKAFTFFWSIVIEVKFYLLFCIFCILVARTGKKLPLLTLLLWLVTLCIPFYIPVIINDKNSVWPFLSFFMGGIAVFVAKNHYDIHALMSQRSWNLLGLASLILLFLSPHPVFTYLTGQNYSYWNQGVWFFSPLMALILLCTLELDGLINRFFSNSISRFTGRISYSIYLINMTIFYFSMHYLHKYIPGIGGLYLNFIFIILIAWILYRLVENPCNQFGKRLSLKIRRI